MRALKSPCSKYRRRTMSRECFTDALSRREFSLSAERPAFLRSAFSRQSVALLTVEMRALAGWAPAPRQAAAAGVAAIASAAAVSAAITSPRIHGRVEPDR